jgi:acetone carboxylase gamma subunit
MFACFMLLATKPVLFTCSVSDTKSVLLVYRCKLTAVFAEVDRVLRPQGKLIVRDTADTINELESMAKSLQWEVRMTYTKGNEGLLCVEKSMWRPKELDAST